jgi:molybdopterin-guanine dinucleotide biosynthesis protein A
MESRRAGFDLAGDRSSHMGGNKALLPWKGSTLIESVAREVLLASGNVTLIGSRSLAWDRYGNLGFPVIYDQVEGCGPLGSLHAALSIPTTGLEPLCAAYHVRLVPLVNSAINPKLFKMHDFISTIAARLLPAPDSAPFSNSNPAQLISEREAQ